MTDWLGDAVFYEIYPQSFCDSNADGIGDFQGIIRKLDYIRGLGCNAIWLNPCFDSPFQDAGYDIRDYYKAAERYGTNEDLKQLFNEVHERGMHIILDLVPGHTSIESRWFQESMKAEKNEFTDRYIWSDSVWDSFEGVNNIRGALSGISERNGAAAVNFFCFQPALNYGFAHPDSSKKWQSAPDSEAAFATRNAIKDVMRFWLKLGADGFRVDMAGSLVKGDEDGSATAALWQDFRHFLDREFPDAAMVSEWGEPDKSLAGGFHMDFLLHFGPSHYMDLFRTAEPYFSRRGRGDVSAFVKKYLDNYKKTGGKGLMCIPSGNHDMLRISDTLTADEIKLAFAFLLSMPGAPYIYYGDEIGMRYIRGMKSKEGGYERTGSRTPMQWDESANCGFSAAEPEMLYLSQDPSEDRPLVSRQFKDESSILNTVKRLISLRHSHKALQADGRIEFLYAEDHAYPFVYRRSASDEEITVIINPSGCQATCSFAMPPHYEELFREGGSISVQGGSVTVPAGSAVIIRAV